MYVIIILRVVVYLRCAPPENHHKTKHTDQ